MSPTDSTARRRLRLQEGGLLIVIVVLGALLSVFGGRVKMPLFQINAQGERQRVFRLNEQGEREAAVVERNKFLNAQNLAQLAKDTSFIAIMAVGASFVIISGGIDLSVGAVYALASVLAAMVFRGYGPEGALGSVSAAMSLPLGILACLGTAALCGLVNGGMIVALRVHPFIITLGTMAIFRGVAFVITKGQSVGGFPAAFSELVKWETFGGLRLVPLLVMVLVTLIGGVYLARLAAGRRIYAVGGNELASRYSGVRIERVKLSVYIIFGLTGGKGSALGYLLGALIIKMIDNGIVILGIDQSYSRIIIGGVVILAVVLDQLKN